MKGILRRNWENQQTLYRLLEVNANVRIFRLYANLQVPCDWQLLLQGCTSRYYTSTPGFWQVFLVQVEGLGCAVLCCEETDTSPPVLYMPKVGLRATSLLFCRPPPPARAPHSVFSTHPSPSPQNCFCLRFRSHRWEKTFWVTAWCFFLGLFRKEISQIRIVNGRLLYS